MNSEIYLIDKSTEDENESFFDTPQLEQLKLETASYYIVKLMLYTWYVVLLVGVFLLWFDWEIQWSCRQVCGEGTCHGLDFTQWGEDSICPMSFEEFEHNNTRTITMNTTLSGSNYHDPLKRFIHMFWTCPTPSNTTVHVTTIPFDISIIYTNPSLVPRVEKLSNTVICPPGLDYCNVAILPLNPTSEVAYVSIRLNFLLFDNVTNPFYNATKKSLLGLVYQKPSYTLTAMACRYVLFILALYTMTTFLTSLGGLSTFRTKKWMVEQRWVFFMSLMLLLYLNPLDALCIYGEPQTTPSAAGFLQFLEHRPPLYFMYIFQTWMLVLVGSMKNAPSPIDRRVHGVCVVWLVAMIGLDLAIAGVGNWDWTLTPTTYAIVFNMTTSPEVIVLYVAMITLQSVWFVYGFFSCIRTYKNLSQKNYLDTRRQQLVFRLFVFVMFAYVTYLVFQLIVFVSQQSRAALLTYQRDQQIGEIVIAFLFVQIIQYCYSLSRFNFEAPYHPQDPRWKRVKWPLQWYIWLQLHGGSVYFFRTENEGDEFYHLQNILADEGKAQVDFTMSPRKLIKQVFQVGYYVSRHTKSMIEKLMIEDQNGVFESAPRFFCLETAISAFNLSWESYMDTLEVERYNHFVLKHIKQATVACIIARHKSRRRITIAFQGTSSKEHILTDLNLIRCRYTDMIEDWNEHQAKTFSGMMMRSMCDVCDTPLVHRGFAAAWDSMKDEVCETVAQVFGAGDIVDEILVTGHSLGGAVATLCAYSLSKLLCVDANNTHISVYTFGMPKVGNAVFRTCYEHSVPTTFRIVNQNDIINRISATAWNYHVGREVCIDELGNI
eukprot:PhF_6_TR13407/c0_g1_i2/m.21335